MRRQLRGGANAALIERIRRGVIGDDAALDGPFGPRPLVYADYTASGRALSFVEDYIRERVLPLYANTHTEASATGLHTTALREDARRVIHQAVGGSDEDVVLFCGSGSTGAIDTLIRVLELRRRDRPVVFIGPYEHHSNELPWRESVADVVTIGEDSDGLVDADHLERELRRHGDRRLKIGSFSAASNVTGIITDVDGVSRVLRSHGALSCWDYATAGPYLPIDMAGKDAVFLSPHKFVGGPGTPGVLVVKRALLRNRVPSVPGGGTVLFVTPDHHTYDPDPVLREEGGTPAIVESIRAGLVFALKEEVGADEIHRRERTFARRALGSWSRNPNIEILGNTTAGRLPIISLGVRHPPGLLHSNFVVALLSDLFGIQARSGCFCAGPYLHRIYRVNSDWSARMETQCRRGQLGAKLGFVRLGFNYFTSEETFQYILDAVHLVAGHGWKLLPLYRFDPDTGLWHHRDHRPAPTLADARIPRRAGDPNHILTQSLERARDIISAFQAQLPPTPVPDPTLSPEFERIRWFPLPGEALEQLRSTFTHSQVEAAEPQRRRPNRTVIRRVLQPSD
ncbi:MAG TPA: aminotransferase class V-fold PLP-dependent enzyme [Solirubrobacteraceae bacterium]|nr:aminotransferase class V-fold PLP-dependent enzyme [Solirubrobacteraceae bacterium]